ncbi:RICIN domain-containing protein [Actinomadura sp. DC4]|uniref:RICIN domain-containing protein n=1 Tax=Actinomadura sp. DC4 TaxID=3055069 RepID=UPI0025B0854C|nr:RICIN domain-containing protein [Actinomadura sp. DC4]MDN3357237.1 RICIN domain-containing protein [Actinomadura sp. DC4]
MSEQNQNERRQERANLVNAFNRRVWQPSEQPQLAPRVLAGGVALILVAGAAFGIGAMKSYSDKKSADEKAKQAALSTRNGSSSSNGNLSRTPVPTAPAGGGGGAAPSSRAPHAPALPRAAAPRQSPAEHRTPHTNSPSPTASASPEAEHLSDTDLKRLATFAAQQGGETAPHMPRPEDDKTPAPSTSPSGTPKAKAKDSAPAKAAKAKRPSAGGNLMSSVLVRNVKSGMCLDLPGNGNGSAGGEVKPSGCNGSSGDNQLWDLVTSQRGAGPGGSDLFVIRNSKDRLCLDLPGSGAASNQALVSEGSCVAGGGDNQRWYLDKKASGQYWVRNYSSSGLCLDVSGNGASGIKDPWISIYTCSLTDDHLWSFS